MVSETDKPLVTFALFAYNQERFIREAVEGAFAQTYSPLQIILSDDCSSDRTFEIMQEMVKDYTGPHNILLNRNAQNLGLGGHLNQVMEFAEGELIVVAAGDDISLPNRVSLLTDAFSADKELFAVFSDIYHIDENSQSSNKVISTWRNDEFISSRQMLISGGGVGPGASYAYRKQCFFWPYSYPSSIMNEDRILPFRASLIGKVRHISNPLVQYRLSDSGQSRSLPPHRLWAILKDIHVKELLTTINSGVQCGITTSIDQKMLEIAIQIGRTRAEWLSKLSQFPSIKNKLCARIINYYFRIHVFIRFNIFKPSK